MGERKPRRFVLLLTTSLVVAAISCLSGGVPPWSGAPKVLRWNEWMDERVAVVLYFSAPLVWIGLTVFAYRNYGKKWRWFLVGAPFALMFQLTVLLIIGAYELCMSLQPRQMFILSAKIQIRTLPSASIRFTPRTDWRRAPRCTRRSRGARVYRPSAQRCSY